MLVLDGARWPTSPGLGVPENSRLLLRRAAPELNPAGGVRARQHPEPSVGNGYDTPSLRAAMPGTR